MKFYEGPEDINDVIQCYYLEKGDMTIFYLSYRVVNITNITDEMKKEIDDLMLKQLQERNANVNLNTQNLKRVFDITLTALLSSSYLANIIKHNNIKAYLTLATLFGLMYLSGQIISDNMKIEEVKKSKLFLDMYEELQTPEGAKAVEELNFDKIYSKELNVNTLDYFSYGEIKEVHKKLKKVK